MKRINRIDTLKHKGRTLRRIESEDSVYWGELTISDFIEFKVEEDEVNELEKAYQESGASNCNVAAIVVGH